MYGDMPNHWSEELSGLARLRFITNAFTRMRFCFPNGQLDMYSKETPESAPAPSNRGLPFRGRLQPNTA